MSTLERLNAKKAALTAQRAQIEQIIVALGQQREQQVANLNATLGAIAAVDELIVEEGKAAIDEAAKAVANDVPPEMPAVQKFEPCAECTTPGVCDDGLSPPECVRRI